ncbi:hypothetical protein AC519_5476 [Pseudomonas savastanoi]|nr:hypothetical protein AC519_5476 [Pseudomonas savastanoi]
MLKRFWIFGAEICIEIIFSAASPFDFQTLSAIMEEAHD